MSNPRDTRSSSALQAVPIKLDDTFSSREDDCVRYIDEVVHPAITLRTMHFSGSEELRFQVSALGVGIGYVHKGAFNTKVDGIKTPPAFAKQLRFFFNGARGEVKAIKKPGTLKSTMVLVEPDYLLSLIPPNESLLPSQLVAILQGDRDQCYFSTVPIASAMAMIAELARNCEYTGTMRRLFLEAKAIEFIALGFHALNTGEADNKSASLTFSKADLARLHEARSILETEYRNPPSIAELSRRVGFNEFKLKSGFRQYFKTTVFSLVLQCRMYEAIRLLHETDLGVAQVGYRVGYSSAAAFSRAFHRLVGCSPKAVREGADLRYLEQ